MELISSLSESVSPAGSSGPVGLVQAAGVYVLELDLSAMTGGDEFEFLAGHNVIPGSFFTDYTQDVYFYGKQASPRWQSAPIVCDANSSLTLGVTNNGGTARTIGWKLFKLAIPQSVDTVNDSFTTGGSATLTSALAGTYVLLAHLYEMEVEGDLVTVAISVDSEVVGRYYFQNANYPDMFVSDPVVASSSGVSVAVTFTALGASTHFEFNLLRVA